MLSIFWPIGTTLALAFLSDLAGSSAPSRRKSIEVCTAMCRMTWMKEDGVVRVYSETTHLNCSRIVVELAPGTTPPYLPGEVEGHPVTVRMGAAYGSEGISPSGIAALKAVATLTRHGRQMQVRPGGGYVRYVPASGEHSIIVIHAPQAVLHPGGEVTTASGPLTEAEIKQLKWYASHNGAIVRIRETGKGATTVEYLPTRHGRSTVSTLH